MWVCVLVIAFGLACTPSPPIQKPNVVLICFDTLRADHMSTYGYSRNTTPTINRLFEGAEIFDRAYTAATYTSASIVSILSGLDPPMHGVRDFYQKLSPRIRLLPEYLAAHGYQTAAIVSNTVLTDEALGLGSRFEYYDDFVGEHREPRMRPCAGSP
jgi:arylsulfatase A-like enzyme